MKEVLKRLILEAESRSIKYLNRNLIDLKYLPNHNYILIGPRRAGKSYYLYEIRDSLKQLFKKNNSDFIYINFEDDRLIDFTYKNFQDILDAYNELYTNKKPILLFDEIQNIDFWDKFLRRLADNDYLVYVTGSNSKMISKEIGSTLGARFITIKVNPFNFKEFLQIKNYTYDIKSLFLTKEIFNFKKIAQEYIEFGSFPEIAKNNMNKLDLLKTYLDLYIYKDISKRWSIENSDNLILILKKIRENIGNEISPNLIYKNLIKVNRQVSVKTIYKYISYLKDVFLIYEVVSYKKSFKNREVQKKYYFSDNGFLKLFEIEDDKGSKLESLVCCELLKRHYDIFYWRNKSGQECDFVIKENNIITNAIQVTFILNETSKEREINGLLQALDFFKLKEGTIITNDFEEKLIIKDKTINIVPIYKWLLK
jgi:predicted AAA+ superfamily ATPase